jgi:hypothetical protein
MKNENKVLACVDQSHFADYVADYAAWAARRMDAPLEFLHVIDRHPEQGSGEDHSGAIGIDAQENLLTKLTAEDEIRTKNAREQGRIFLNRLRERATAAGAALVDVRQRTANWKRRWQSRKTACACWSGSPWRSRRNDTARPGPQCGACSARPAQTDPDRDRRLQRAAARDDRLRWR